MTEEQAPYQVGNGPEFTLDDLAGRDCARPFTDPRYRPPTPEEVKGLIKLAGWSQNEAALIVGVKYDTEKGSTTIRKWRTEEGRKEHRQIPYSAWRLMLISAGVVNQELEVEP